jgi:hypothetical protein
MKFCCTLSRELITGRKKHDNLCFVSTDAVIEFFSMHMAMIHKSKITYRSVTEPHSAQAKLVCARTSYTTFHSDRGYESSIHDSLRAQGTGCAHHIRTETTTIGSVKHVSTRGTAASRSKHSSLPQNTFSTCQDSPLAAQPSPSAGHLPAPPQ